MGTFRTVTTELQCQKCDAWFTAGIQFKTGDDGDMPEYAIGDRAEDIEPGVYNGLGDAFCPQCAAMWIEDERRAHFECLAREVETGW